jgi:uncharacterized delta-60 repeat protein
MPGPGSKRTAFLLLLASLLMVSGAGADGMLDPSFGNGGLVMTNFPQGPSGFSPDAAYALVVLPDGRAVAAGASNYGDYVALARYLTSGALDPSFGGDGTVEFPCPGSWGLTQGAQAMLLQPDGRLVVLGRCPNFALPNATQFRLSRVNANGSVDGTFGSSGHVLTPFATSAWVSAGVLQPDGRIIAVGNAGSMQAPMIAAARYNSNGSLDPAFGTAGQLTLPLAQPFVVSDALVQADGKLVIAGTYGPTGAADFGLVRLLPSGAVDPSFDGDGLVTTDFGLDERGDSAIVLADGRLILSGSRNADLALARYLADGSLDVTFGTGGLATADSGAADSRGRLIRLPNGNLLAAGTRTSVDEDFLLARFLPDGALDTSFGTGGFIWTNFPTAAVSRDFCSAVAVAGPDLILTAGIVFQPVMSSLTPDFGLARYIATTPVELLAFEVE